MGIVPWACTPVAQPQPGQQCEPPASPSPPEQFVPAEDVSRAGSGQAPACSEVWPGEAPGGLTSMCTQGPAEDEDEGQV